ncbi:Hypothetical predicted protein, partial [Pelobates cultripes]
MAATNCLNDKQPKLAYGPSSATLHVEGREQSDPNGCFTQRLEAIFTGFWAQLEERLATSPHQHLREACRTKQH